MRNKSGCMQDKGEHKEFRGDDRLVCGKLILKVDRDLSVSLSPLLSESLTFVHYAWVQGPVMPLPALPSVADLSARAAPAAGASFPCRACLSSTLSLCCRFLRCTSKLSTVMAGPGVYSLPGQS